MTVTLDPAVLAQMGVTVRQSHCTTFLNNWHSIWPVPHRSARKRFTARFNHRPGHNVEKHFPTRRAAMIWLVPQVLRQLRGAV